MIDTKYATTAATYTESSEGGSSHRRYEQRMRTKPAASTLTSYLFDLGALKSMFVGSRCPSCGCNGNCGQPSYYSIPRRESTSPTAYRNNPNLQTPETHYRRQRSSLELRIE